ncbi:LuxR C-terminal-related transcriptional regulator [Nodosilinea sp. FACHB-13]|uniref:response regulator transcription factor n=1 Tax=Cyanophyceae TaxID=3028117 RepID=UPI0018EF728C|nr:LuxR C-terminal-related transcriptional regulator [Nodosilinea sp. FACHB-13]
MQPFSSVQTPTEFNLSTRILDSFDINQQHYCVVMLADSASGVNGSESEDEEAQFIEISRFEVNGYLCAVVKVEPELSAANDLTRLLTDRELQVATLVAMGRPNKQIARQLRISEWTVSTHLRRIFLKLGVDSRAAMVYRCASMIQCQT